MDRARLVECDEALEELQGEELSASLEEMVDDCLSRRGQVVRRRVKTLSLVAALVLAGAVAFGSTSAWLIARSSSVVNTFTYGNVDISLAETDTDDGDGDPGTNRYKMLPGSEITKDPKVTVKAGGIDCWLFARLEPSANFGDFMEFDLAEGWTTLSESAPGVFYREVEGANDDQAFGILAGDRVMVKSAVTKRMLDELESDPTLTVSAYAVQKAGFETAAAAWVQVDGA